MNFADRDMGESISAKSSRALSFSFLREQTNASAIWVSSQVPRFFAMSRYPSISSRSSVGERIRTHHASARLLEESVPQENFPFARFPAKSSE